MKCLKNLMGGMYDLQKFLHQGNSSFHFSVNFLMCPSMYKSVLGHCSTMCFWKFLFILKELQREKEIFHPLVHLPRGPQYPELCQCQDLSHPLRPPRPSAGWIRSGAVEPNLAPLWGPGATGRCLAYCTTVLAPGSVEMMIVSLLIFLFQNFWLLCVLFNFLRILEFL